MKGQIVRWVDERGFGFINSNELDGDISMFICIREVQKSGYHRPRNRGPSRVLNRK